MPARVYVQLDLVCADSVNVARNLCGKPGVSIVEFLDSPPDKPSLLLVIEAAERLKAARYLMDVLESVEDITENLRVLPVKLRSETLSGNPGRN